VSPEYFFGPDNESRDRRLHREQQAKQICQSCPVMSLCRAHAVAARESYGIWGATTARERDRLTAVPQVQPNAG
jgi:WhiB family redox-sensing transcriptional regulator